MRQPRTAGVFARSIAPIFVGSQGLGSRGTVARMERSAIRDRSCHPHRLTRITGPQRAVPPSGLRSRRRPEAPGARHFPGVTEARVVGAVDELTRPQGGIELVETHDFTWRHPAGEMRRHELAWMI